MKNCSKHIIIRTMSHNKGYQGVAIWANGKDPDRS